MAWLAPLERGIKKMTGSYTNKIDFLLKRSARIGILALIMFAATGWLTKEVPTGFVPGEDQGYLFVNVQLPDAASSGRTAEVMRKVGEVIKNDPAVTDFISVAGTSLLSGAGSNNGLGIIILKDWEERTTPELGYVQVIRRIMGQLWTMPDAQVMVFNPPPIPGLR